MNEVSPDRLIVDAEALTESSQRPASLIEGDDFCVAIGMKPDDTARYALAVEVLHHSRAVNAKSLSQLRNRGAGPSRFDQLIDLGWRESTLELH